DTGTGPAGTLCLRKLPAPAAFGTERKGNSGFDDYQDTENASTRRMAAPPQLVVIVDQRAPVIVDQKQGGCIEGLALDVTHDVRASRPGVSRQAARFSFPRGDGGGDILELRYDPFYGAIHIDPSVKSAAATAGAAPCAVCPVGSPKRVVRTDVGISGHHTE